MARTKYVHTYAMVAHLWAHQTQDSARVPAGNFYFDGDTIYSYGRHFPIARHLRGKILFTERGYSPTTTKHIAFVRQAISHRNADIITVPDLTNNFDSNIVAWRFQIENLLNELANPRIRDIEGRMNRISRIQAKVTTYATFMKMKISKADKAVIFATNDVKKFESYKEKANALRMKREAQEKLDRTKGLKLLNQWLDAWRNYTEKDLKFSSADKTLANTAMFADGNHNRVWLRTNDVNVETSKGIVMPVTVARRFYLKYLSVVAAGGCNGSCNYKMLDFDVKRMDQTGLLVGCHDVSRTEIDYLAARLNWK